MNFITSSFCFLLNQGYLFCLPFHACKAFHVCTWFMWLHYLPSISRTDNCLWTWAFRLTELKKEVLTFHRMNHLVLHNIFFEEMIQLCFFQILIMGLLFWNLSRPICREPATCCWEKDSKSTCCKHVPSRWQGCTK